MSTAGLFTIGVLVTLIVDAAMALPIYAAILDGRDAAARQTADREPPTPRRGGEHPPDGARRGQPRTGMLGRTCPNLGGSMPGP